MPVPDLEQNAAQDQEEEKSYSSDSIEGEALER